MGSGLKGTELGDNAKFYHDYEILTSTLLLGQQQR